MRPLRLILRFLILALVSGLSGGVLAFELPAELPLRNEGLWIIDHTGAISDGETTISIQKIWNACLDAKADRALHQLEILAEQASVASLNETCEEPDFALSGNVLFSTMQCSGPSPLDGKTSRSEIHRTTTFINGGETHAQSTTHNRGMTLRSRGASRR